MPNARGSEFNQNATNYMHLHLMYICSYVLPCKGIVLYCIVLHPLILWDFYQTMRCHDTSSPVMNYIINHPSKQLWLNMQGQSDIPFVLGRLIGLSTQAWQGLVCVSVYHLCMVFCIAHGTQELFVFCFFIPRRPSTNK